MTAVEAADEITDAMAYVEMQRQEMEEESGTAAACVESMRKLQQLLAQESATAGSAPGADAATANVAAIKFEIRRIQRMASGRRKGTGKKPRSGHQHHAPARHDPHTQPRNKGGHSRGARGGR